MFNNKISALTAVAGLGLLGSINIASAATVYCPPTLTPTLTRQVEVTGALAGGLCAYQTGNFNGDDFSDYFPDGVDLIDKDITSEDGAGGNSEGGLFYTGTTSGTWAMGSDLWATYGNLYLAFHFGNGSGDPDGFIVELDPGALSGLWALLPTSLANGLSNIYLLGNGEPSSSSSGGGSGSGGQVPEPGSLALLGLGLLGLGAAARRRTK